MRALYVGTDTKEGLGTADAGYFTPDRDILVSAREQGSDADNASSIAEIMEPLVESDDAYRVEVMGLAGGILIGLTSNSVDVTTYLEEKLERRSHGTEQRHYQKAGEQPVLPRNMENAHEGLEMYAEWALENGKVSGIEMEVDWESVLDGENLARR